MNYLMIYEAFQSKAISNVIKYIKKNNSTNVNRFISDLKNIQDIYDFPIEKIKSEDIRYLSSNKAIKLVPDSSTNYYNNMRIFNVKFWFSIEDGYLGRTATGDYTYISSGKLTDYDIEYIKNDLNIKTGKLTPVGNYKDLKHGDYVIVSLGETDAKLTDARIYKEGSRIYAIQNSRDGAKPSSDYTSWGLYSWMLSSENGINNDHTKLNIYSGGHGELKILSDNNYIDLFINSDGGLDVYGRPIYSDSSDFTIILDINNIFRKGFKKVSGIRSERKESRHGSIRFMNDEEIKSANIDRYFNQILNNMGIKPDSISNELKNLQNIVKLATLRDLPFYSIYNNEPEIQIIKTLSHILGGLIEQQDSYYYDKLVSSYKTIKSSNIELISKYRNSLSIINNHGDKDVKLLFSKFEEINKVIKNYIESLTINNLQDLNAIFYRFEYIRKLIFDEFYYFTSKTSDLINGLDDPNDIDYYLKRFSSDEIEEDIKKTDFLYKNIKSVFTIN